MRSFNFASSHVVDGSGASHSLSRSVSNLHKMAETWRAIWVTDLANRSATLKSLIQDWFVSTVMAAQVVNTFLGLRPGLQSGTRNLDHPSKTTEVLSSGAFDLWDDLTIPEICSDPLGHLPRTHIFRNIVEFFVALAHGRDP